MTVSTTKRLNEQVRRNQERFPEDFAFLMKHAEVAHLKSQFATSNSNSLVVRDLEISRQGGRQKLPRVFTEHGALMAANVLNSPEAVKMSIFIIHAFVKQREALAANQTILRRLAEIDQSLLLRDAALCDLKFEVLTHRKPLP